MQSTQRTTSPNRSLEADARTWEAFARKQGARFDVHRKAQESVQFSRSGNASTLGIATNLRGVSDVRLQNNLDTVRLHGADARHDELTLEADGEGAVWVAWQGFWLGRLKDKHARWIRPLLWTGRVRVHLLRVTGGTTRKPTLGCNVAISGVGDAIHAAQAASYGFRVRTKA